MTKKVKGKGKGQRPAKVPRSLGIVPDVADKHFSWRLDQLVIEGDWGWDSISNSTLLLDVIPKLHDFETMTWKQVEGPTGSHFVEVESLCKDGQQRLRALGRDTVERLFSLRISGRVRVWGVRENAVLRIWFWDPEHSLCPSLLKHT